MLRCLVNRHTRIWIRITNGDISGFDDIINGMPIGNLTKVLEGSIISRGQFQSVSGKSIFS